MYRIRLPNGEERAIESMDALVDAVRDGTVTATSDIWHQRADQWLPILRHPHFQLASSRVAAEPARSTVTPVPMPTPAVAPPPAPPAVDLAQTLALLELLPDPEPSVERAAARPAPTSLEATATPAPTPPAPAAPAPAPVRRRSRELEFVYVPESAPRARAAEPRLNPPPAVAGDEIDPLDDAPAPTNPAAGLPLLDIAFEQDPIVDGQPEIPPTPEPVVPRPAPAPVAAVKPAAPAAPAAPPAPVARPLPAGEPVRSTGSFGAFQLEDDDYDDWTPAPADPALAAVLTNRSRHEIDLGPIGEPSRLRRTMLLGGTTLALAGAAFLGWRVSRPADAAAAQSASAAPVETTTLGSNPSGGEEAFVVTPASAPAAPVRVSPAARAVAEPATLVPSAPRDGFGGTDRNPGFVPRAAAAALSADSVRVVAPEGLGVPAIEPVALPSSVAPDPARDAARQAVLRSIADRAARAGDGETQR